MNQAAPDPQLEEQQEELDKAIDELRGALHDAPPAESGLAGAPAGDTTSNAGVIMNILVDVQIVLGSTEIPVSDLLTLQKGATIALDRRIGEPVDIMVNGRKIARGEITVLESDPSRFGIRVIDIASAKPTA